MRERIIYHESLMLSLNDTELWGLRIESISVEILASEHTDKLYLINVKL